MAWTMQALRQSWPEHERDWVDLNCRLNHGHPLLSVDFVAPLVNHFSLATDQLATVRQGRTVCGMLMLRRDHLRWRAFMPSQAQVAPTLLVHASLLDSLWPTLGPWACVLDLLGQDSEHSALPAKPLHARHEVIHHATTLKVHIEGSFESYWKGRSKSLQNDIRGKFNRLGADGLDAELQVHETAAELHAALLRYAELETRSWKGSQGTALQVGSTQTAFYRDVLERFARGGNASIFELTIGGQLAASEIVVRGGAMAVLLKTTHDARRMRYAPGYLLDHLLLEHEFARRRVEVVEFYTAADEHKLRWGTGAHDIHHHSLYRWASAQRAVALARRVRAWDVAARGAAAGQAS